MEQRTYTATNPDILPSYETVSMLEAMLMPGERLVNVASVSVGIYWKCAAVLLVALITLFYSLTLALYFLVIGVILGVLAFRTRRFLMLGTTDRRIIASGGVLTQELIDFPYESIESVELFTSPMGMLFNYASVIVTGLGRKRLMIPFIRNAGSFHDDAVRILLERQQRMTQH